MMHSLLFVAFAAAWLMLPLLPALMELYKPTDDGALDVFQGNAADARDGLHDLLPQLFSTPTADWAAGLQEKQALLWTEPQLESSSAVTQSHLASPLSLRVQGCPSPLVSLHANELTLASGLVTGVRMSAARWALLEPAVKFQVLQAPLIRTGRMPASPQPERATPAQAGTVKGAKHYPVQQWWRAAGDAAVDADSVVQGDIIAEGRVVIGSGSRIEGSLKTKGEVVLEEGAIVLGNVVAHSVRVCPGATVQGSVLATTTVVLETDTVIGSPATPASVVCAELTLRLGVSVHGGICANTCAEVLPS
jgi:hypothetical protein